MSGKQREQLLRKRLRPLYIAAFSQGFVCWYAIEKLFMKSIGYDDATIGIMVAFYSVVMLAAETPSGILADRWSRKGVLIIASISLALSGLIGGLSTNIIMYLVAAGLWGLFFALYSGTYDSIVYDVIEEEKVPNQRYEHYFGRTAAAESIGLVISSVLGGVIANYMGLRLTYFLSIPTVLVSVLALLKFREPQLHKAQVKLPIKQHIQTTFSAVLRKRALVPVLIVLVAVMALVNMGEEFGQMWPIALSAPVMLFGPFNALLLSSWGLGGLAAGSFKLHRYPVMMTMMGLMLTSSLGLVFSRNLAVVIACFTVLLVSLTGLSVVFTRLLHDSLGSNVRAGAASAVSTLGRLVIIPLSLVFGYTSNRVDIFHASWMLVGLVVVVAIFVHKTYTEHKDLPDMSNTQSLPATDPYKK